MKLFAYVDGASRGNPGEAGVGVLIRDEQGRSLKQIGRYVGKTTNNTAEYKALLACLRSLETLCPRNELEELTVYSDSELLVKQIQGDYRVRDTNLKRLQREVLNLIEKGSYRFEIRHIDGERNKEAHRLASKAINLRMK